MPTGPIIIYMDSQFHKLYTAWCENFDCQDFELTQVASQTPYDGIIYGLDAILLDGVGPLLIAYFFYSSDQQLGNSVKVVSCHSPSDCKEANPHVLKAEQGGQWLYADMRVRLKQPAALEAKRTPSVTFNVVTEGKSYILMCKCQDAGCSTCQWRTEMDSASADNSQRHTLETKFDSATFIQVLIAPLGLAVGLVAWGGCAPRSQVEREVNHRFLSNLKADRKFRIMAKVVMLLTLLGVAMALLPWLSYWNGATIRERYLVFYLPFIAPASTPAALWVSERRNSPRLLLATLVFCMCVMVLLVFVGSVILSNLSTPCVSPDLFLPGYVAVTGLVLLIICNLIQLFVCARLALVLRLSNPEGYSSLHLDWDRNWAPAPAQSPRAPRIKHLARFPNS